MTKFSVNLNKIALLRNSRGGNRPDLLAFARRCIARGVHGITVHPRPDERHARYADVVALADLIRPLAPVEFNVEGYPLPRFLQVVTDNRPDQCTLVPDAPDQITSDHGWNAVRERDHLIPIVRHLKDAGVRVSLFLDPDPQQVEAAAATGADRIELYTESYARAAGTADEAAVLRRFADAAQLASRLGLAVNAGHDLSLDNLARFLDAVPQVVEVSIGHAVFCEALDFGLEPVLDRYLAIVNRS